MSQDLETAIGERTVPAAQIQLLQLRHVRQVLQAVVGEQPRPAGVDCRHELET